MAKKKSSKSKGLGSPPDGFNKAERKRWREYRSSNRYLRSEHREIVRGAVQTVLEYEDCLARLRKLIMKGTPTTKVTTLKNHTVMLQGMVKDYNNQLVKVTLQSTRGRRGGRVAGTANDRRSHVLRGDDSDDEPGPHDHYFKKGVL